MKLLKYALCCALLLGLQTMGISQRNKKDKNAKTDTTVKAAVVDTVPVVIKDTTVVDSTLVAVDTVAAQPPVVAVAKDCFQDWYEKMRTRGAKPVTDGEHPVVITLKSEDACVCLMGKISVVDGKIKPPLMLQLEDGEFKTVESIGKKLDPVFAATLSEDELFKVVDGMSILFRTNAQEYGRLIFYTFANKSAKSNKTAPSPDELMKD